MKKKTDIEILIDAQIKETRVYQNLWVVYRNSKISRREFVDLMSRVPNDAEKSGIRFVWPGSQGQEYEFPEIDDLIDPEGRWFSNYVQRADKGYKPRSYSKKYGLLRLMMTYLDLNHSHTAQLVRKPLIQTD